MQQRDTTAPPQVAVRQITLREPMELTPSALATRLVGAKPVTWRGRGDLPQFPWGISIRGTWLVLDLWAGIGGLCIALLALGVHIYAISAESDPVASAAAQAAMPNLVHIDSVEELKGADLRQFLQRRQVRGIILGGGSPCQGNSSLNRGRQGLNDPRSQQPSQLRRLREEILALPEARTCEVITFLENVASMPQSVCEQYSTWLGAQPVLSDAAGCGWVHRRRLYWLASRSAGLSSRGTPPSDWVWQQGSGSRHPTLHYCGKKPIPAQVWWDDHFRPMLDPKQVMQAQGSGAMHPFTREFFHPTDRLAQVTPAAAARFHQDNRRFPPAAYEENSLLWSGDNWRQPSPDERSQLMGVPVAATHAVQGSQDQRTKLRNSLLGNGFHIPSVMALLCCLPSIMEAKLTKQPFDVEELGLAERLCHTVWSPGRLATMPGILSAGEVCAELQATFPFLPCQEAVWPEVSRRLAACELATLQAYPMWRRLRQESWSTLGPTPVWGRERTAIYAGLTGQRYASNAAKGLDHLLPPGMGKQEHIAAALELPSPFAPRPWPEPDMSFVIQAVATWRQALPRWAEKLRHVLATVARAVTPLEDALNPFRCQSARKVAMGKRPAFVATMVALLRWPDKMLARSLVLGFDIVGDMEHSGVFRPIVQEGKLSLDQWLGTAAEADLDRLLRTRPPEHVQDILDLTNDEIEKEFCSPLRTAREMDDLFGVGGWRFVERFLIIQPDGKKRAIDNARKSGHNAHTTMHETISTVNVDFCASVARMLHSEMPFPVGSPPEWLDIRLGTDDLPDAYRGLPVADSHLPFSNVAIFVPSLGWRFTCMWGLAYGLESVVVNFNRFPQLGIAITRRCLLGCSAAYFDDELSVECIRDSDVSQRSLQLVFRLLGAPPQSSKSFVPAPNRHYLGTSVHVGDFGWLGVIRFQPKTSTTRKVQAKLREAIATRHLRPDDAGKLRGDLNWLFSMCAGQAGRFAGPVLAAKQHAATPELADAEVTTLRLLSIMLHEARPRDIEVCSATKSPLVIYSDASFEKGTLRVGWVLMTSPPLGVSCLVPSEVTDSWIERHQQIYPGETLCGLLVPWVHGDILAGRDLLWFVDNEAAVSSLIKGSSGQEDVHAIVQLAHLIFQKRQIRPWIEWIDSASNPSDGLSRLGIEDEWTRTQPWRLCELSFPVELYFVSRPTDLQPFLSYLNSG